MITSADSNKTINAIVGQEVGIALIENPTTGYRWTYHVSGGDINLVSDDYNLPKGSGAGGGGTRVFIFKVKTQGLIKLDFQLCRAWEKDIPGIENFTINLSVK